MRCDFLDCSNKAEYFDLMDSPVCKECMEREIKEGGSEPEDFQNI